MRAEQLKQELAEAISEIVSLDREEVFELLEQPKNQAFGDLAFPCFSLAKEQKKSPPQCAEELAGKVKLPQGVESAATKGPFLNFCFSKTDFTQIVIKNVIENPEHTNKEQNSNTKILLDYSSPNIAKPYHVGHLRTTLIGNSLYRVYEHLGYAVESIDHLGDWGTQFGFVYAGSKLWGLPEEESVSALVDLYRKATGLKEAQEKNEVSAEDSKHPDVNQLARDYFLDLEAGKDYAREFWQWCRDISLKYLKETDARLGVSFDHYIGEAFYADKLDSVKEQLESANILEESQGAFGVDLGEELGFARVLTPDGRSLYLSRDLAAVNWRMEQFNFDRTIYVVGAPQALHFKQLIAILDKIKSAAAGKIEHVAFGHVRGMKTRGGGNFIELNEFIDEAKNRALEAYRTQVEKRPEGLNEEEVADAVGKSAIIFSTLSKTRISDVEFSWENALKFNGTSGPYLLYAYARINGVRAKAESAGINLNSNISGELLKENSAYKLCVLLDEFYSTLDKVVLENDPFYLANYAVDVAQCFSTAYSELKVVGEEQATSEARLALFEATRLVLKKSIELLGINPVERM